jgi:hypothetical protein
VGFGYGDWWRRLFMGVTLGTPLLLAVLGWAPTSRAPLPGELFAPSDLTFVWWKVAVWVAVAAMGLGAGAWRWLARRSGPTPKHEATLTIGERDFVIRIGEREHRYPIAAVEHAFWCRQRLAVMVRLRGGRELAIGAKYPMSADIEGRLRPHPSRRAARIPIGPVANAFGGLGGLLSVLFAIWLFATVVLTGSIGSALTSGAGTSPREWVALGASWLTLLLTSLAMRRRSAVVGADGVRIDGTLRSRFVPFAEVATAQGTDRSTVLRRHRGLDVALPSVAAGGELLARAREALELARSDDGPQAPEGLDQGERSTAAWQQALRAMQGDRSYRREALRIEELEQLVRAPAAPPARRVAAAVALAADKGGRNGIRIAAAACADRDLEAALEAAAEGEIAASRLSRAERRYQKAQARRRKALAKRGGG